MDSATRSLPLLQPSDDGLSAKQLQRRAADGELTRLRRGVYTEHTAWQNAYPSERHLSAAAAVALTKRRPIFCRETALALHRVPLLHSPRAVHLRTADSRKAHTEAAPARGRTQSSPAVPELRHLSLPKPRHLSRAESDAAYRAGALAVPLAPLTPGIFAEQLNAEPPRAAVEELPFAVVDAVPRMTEAAGIVVLDAVLGGRVPGTEALSPEELSRWEGFLPSGASQRAWEQRLTAADGRSESVGESWSRVLIRSLGFAAPVLQHEERLPDGRVARTDFWWEEAGILGEFDGRVKYSRGRQLQGLDLEQVLYQEKLREDALRALGRIVVRWGWDELRRPRELARRLRAAGVPLS